MLLLPFEFQNNMTTHLNMTRKSSSLPDISGNLTLPSTLATPDERQLMTASTVETWSNMNLVPLVSLPFDRFIPGIARGVLWWIFPLGGVMMLTRVEMSVKIPVFPPVMLRIP